MVPPRRLRCEADFYRLTFPTQPPCGFLQCCQFRIFPFWKHLPKAVVLALVSPQSPVKKAQKSVELYRARVETSDLERLQSWFGIFRVTRSEKEPVTLDI